MRTHAFSRGVPSTLSPSGRITLEETTVSAPLAKNCWRLLATSIQSPRSVSYSYHLVQLLALDLLVTIPALRSAQLRAAICEGPSRGARRVVASSSTLFEMLSVVVGSKWVCARGARRRRGSPSRGPRRVHGVVWAYGCAGWCRVVG